MYGTLLEVAAYTAAVNGNRHTASDLIGEATATARRLGQDANHHFTAFGPSGVTLYQVSIAQVASATTGPPSGAAKTLRPAAIPTAERRGRYWIDVARAYHQWGKPEPCYRALLSAEHAAPAEVRYRPPVHRITEDLLRASRRQSLPGLPRLRPPHRHTSHLTERTHAQLESSAAICRVTPTKTPCSLRVSAHGRPGPRAGGLDIPAGRVVPFGLVLVRWRSSHPGGVHQRAQQS